MTAPSDAAPEITGPWIKARRSALKWSQGKLAQAVGVAQGTVSSWETGRASPAPELYDKLRAALGGAQLSLADAPKAPAGAGQTAAAEPAKMAAAKTRGRRKKGASKQAAAQTAATKPAAGATERQSARGATAAGSLGFEDKL